VSLCAIAKCIVSPETVSYALKEHHKQAWNLRML